MMEKWLKRQDAEKSQNHHALTNTMFLNAIQTLVNSMQPPKQQHGAYLGPAPSPNASNVQSPQGSLRTCLRMRSSLNRLQPAYNLKKKELQYNTNIFSALDKLTFYICLV